MTNELTTTPDEHEQLYKHFWFEVERMQTELNRPRCATCDRIDLKDQNLCTVHGPVPAEARWVPHECGDFLRIPF